MLEKSKYIRFATNLNNTQKLLMLDALMEYKTIKVRTLDYYSSFLAIDKKMLISYLKDLSKKDYISELNYSSDLVKFKINTEVTSTLEKIKETANFDFNLFLDFIDYKKRLLKSKGKKRAFEDTQFIKTAKALNDLNDYDLANATMELTIERGWIGLFPEQAKSYLMQKRAANLKTQNISISELIKAPNNTIIQNGVKYTAVYTPKGWEIEQCVAS